MPCGGGMFTGGSHQPLLELLTFPRYGPLYLPHLKYITPAIFPNSFGGMSLYFRFTALCIPQPRSIPLSPSRASLAGNKLSTDAQDSSRGSSIHPSFKLNNGAAFRPENYFCAASIQFYGMLQDPGPNAFLDQSSSISGTPGVTEHRQEDPSCANDGPALSYINGARAFPTVNRNNSRMIFGCNHCNALISTSNPSSSGLVIALLLRCEGVVLAISKSSHLQICRFRTRKRRTGRAHLMLDGVPFTPSNRPPVTVKDGGTNRSDPIRAPSGGISGGRIDAQAGLKSCTMLRQRGNGFSPGGSCFDFARSSREWMYVLGRKRWWATTFLEAHPLR
ncbi:hypothetical protein FB451DRAFT_1473130 [Mycena latifolia]|nr:hypothetical protein FB451DRAFT_1473130 [Mycena latifolia]